MDDGEEEEEGKGMIRPTRKYSDEAKVN